MAEEGGERKRGKENNTKVSWRRGKEKEESRTEERREECASVSLGKFQLRTDTHTHTHIRKHV